MAIAINVIAIPTYVIFMFAYGASPRALDVGYQPEQPVPYSHALHAGKMGIDCRYCHTTVETAAHAAIPPTQTCMGCHVNILATSEKIVPLKKSYETGLPVEWIKVHDLPDYAYFNHSAHIRRGVGCASCHGRIDKMEIVYQDQPLNMAWCLDCHRNPDPHLRPADLVTKMDWVPPTGKEREDQLKEIKQAWNINPSTNCSTCHR